MKDDIGVYETVHVFLMNAFLQLENIDTPMGGRMPGFETITVRQMLHEVENHTEVGDAIVAHFVGAALDHINKTGNDDMIKQRLENL